ncbi:alkaline phosphatase family protein [Demequina sp.]|uniref:alkaline phosphatase family protein n=1 Tax=Demequina sp. TaxID=2050685 RepID=UPI003D0C59EF
MRRRIAEALAQLLAIAITVWLSPGVRADHWWSYVTATALVLAVSWALRPLLAAFARRFGWAGAAVTALFAEAVILGLALAFTPGMHVETLWQLILASWIYGAVAAALFWVVGASSDDYLIDHAVRLARRRPAPEVDDAEGVLILQLDGVPAPVLEYELRAGNLPTIARWLRDGTHSWTEWTARVPSTTPVSQAGILHGTTENLPAFRWYDRELGRMLVANKPADAAVIEERLSNGRGLLADDGISISNLFDGDAPHAQLTMSSLENKGRALGPSGSYAAFLTHPTGLARAVTLTLGEMIKELFQARRQRRQGVEPRIHRGGPYVALRGVTNVLLRDLNIALVADAMLSGRKVIYADFVDYDEIAHHAGVTRPESLASLYGLDRVVGSLEALAARAELPRRYRIVLVSDHGQSQGATFLQRYGVSLADFVSSHVGGGAVAVDEQEGEARGRVRSLIEGLGESLPARVVARAVPPTVPDAAAGSADAPGIAVVGSGNLGGIWFTDSSSRLSLAQLESVHPGLIEALATHPGVAFVVVQGATGPVAVGAHGAVQLDSGAVTGEDPLADFPAARADFARVCEFASAPDIYVNSVFDPALGEVAAFEELVGCHGGLGGWQTRPLLVHPADWTVDADLSGASGLLEGAESVHRQLVRWLEALGHRADVENADAMARSAEEPSGT